MSESVEKQIVSLRRAEWLLRSFAILLCGIGLLLQAMGDSVGGHELGAPLLVLLLEALVWLGGGRQTVSPSVGVLLILGCLEVDPFVQVACWILATFGTLFRCRAFQVKQAFTAMFSALLALLLIGGVQTFGSSQVIGGIARTVCLGFYPMFCSPSARETAMLTQAGVQCVAAAAAFWLFSPPAAVFFVASVSIEWVRKDLDLWEARLVEYRTKKRQQSEELRSRRTLKEKGEQNLQLIEERTLLKDFLYSQPHLQEPRDCRMSMLDFVSEFTDSSFVWWQSSKEPTAETLLVVKRNSPPPVDVLTLKKLHLQALDSTEPLTSVRTSEGQWYLIGTEHGVVGFLRESRVGKETREAWTQTLLLLSIVETVSCQRWLTKEATRSAERAKAVLESQRLELEYVLHRASTLLQEGVPTVENKEKIVSPSLAKFLQDMIRISKDADDFLELEGRQAEELKRVTLAKVEASRRASFGTFAAGVAHEINTPLGTVLLTLDQLQMAGGEGDRALNEAAESTLELQKLIEAVLSFSRENVELTTELELVSLLRTSASLLADRLESSGMTLTLGGLESLLVKGRQGAIQQLLFDSFRWAAGSGSTELQVRVFKDQRQFGIEFEVSGKGLNSPESDDLETMNFLAKSEEIGFQYDKSSVQQTWSFSWNHEPLRESI